MNTNQNISTDPTEHTTNNPIPPIPPILPEPPSTNRPHTQLGTPHSPAWDAAHIALVEAAELQLNRPICGARTLSGKPCLLAPNHENGRCKYHGGFNLTGAQPGNRNAVVHGLYSRAIQTCGDHCPMWKTCPCAAPEVMKLDPKDRPQCPYEVAAFNATVTDLRAKLAARPHADPMEQHIVSEMATMRVIQMRAATALSVKSVVDATIVTSENRGTSTMKPGAYLQAYLRIASEQRRYTQLYNLAQPEPATAPDIVLREQEQRTQRDTSLAPEDLAILDTPEPPSEQHAKRLLIAAERSMYGTPIETFRYSFLRAEFLAPHLAEKAYDPRSIYYIPRYSQNFTRRTTHNNRPNTS